MKTAFRTSLPALAVGAALAVVAGARPAWGQVQHHEHTDAGADAVEDSMAAERELAPADLSAEQIEVLAAAAAELMPLLPHEPDGQPGSAVEAFALLGSVVDSLGERGKVALSREETDAIIASLEERDVRAHFCGAGCQGRYGDVATSFHVPALAGEEATVWVLTFWAIGQLPDQPPDRVKYRADQFRMRRASHGWDLIDHSVLREELRMVIGPSPSSQE